MSEQKQKAGFIAILGPTNSGKSTLVNALVGRKISIVSPRVQTTYHALRGIVTEKDIQYIFVDTPGLQRHSERIARLLNRVAEKQASEADVTVWVFDVSSPTCQRVVEALLPKIKKLKAKKPALCVLNKVDKIPKPSLLPFLEWMASLQVFDEVVPISALKNNGVKRLQQSLDRYLPEGPQFYGSDVVTDRPLDFQMSERVREKIYQVTRQEIPYTVRVDLEPLASAQGEEKKVPTIFARLHVDSPSRRGILIGKGGQALKTIGTRARKDIEELLGRQVCLKLHVDVEKDWRDDARRVNRYLELE